MPAHPIRVVIADDHEIFRDGFKVLMRKRGKNHVNIVAEACDGFELLDLVGELKPDVVITDVKMPRMNGITACRKIREQFNNISVLAMSSFDEDYLIYDMFDAGASGYLFKNSGKEDIFSALEAVQMGEHYYSSITSPALLKKLAPSPYNKVAMNQSVFTDKEKEIMRAICQQLTTKEIATDLTLNRRTVEDYSHSIKEKTGTRNIVGIALYAVKKGIYDIQDFQPQWS
jgi:DNA-binding NarL/FixJ family response regulator